MTRQDPPGHIDPGHLNTGHLDTGHLIVGPERHGVVRHARAVADAVGGPTVVVAGPAELSSVTPTGARHHHVHFTDRLFGASAREAAANFADVAASLATPVSVTLHDVPQASDGRAFAERRDAYRDVVDVARGVVVSSDHEKSLLAEFLGPVPDVRVVPLAVERVVTTSAPTARDEVGVLGFIYPGKGHTEVLDAIAAIRADVGLLAIGTPSDGHADLAADLEERGRRVGVGVTVTGFVDDADLIPILRSVAAPVAFHRHLSASASINTWIAAGRRPLVPRNRYTTEMEARSSGALWVHDDSEAGLRDALTAALAHPERTWTDDTSGMPTFDDVAGMYRALVDEWSR